MLLYFTPTYFKVFPVTSFFPALPEKIDWINLQMRATTITHFLLVLLISGKTTSY
jgi:hypothetical protein